MKKLRWLIVFATLGIYPIAGSETAGAVAPTACSPGALRVTLGTTQGAAGSFITPIVFTNTGGLCTIEGVPSAQPLSAAKKNLGPVSANNSMGMMAVLLTLHTGQRASTSWVVGDTANYPVGRCHAQTAHFVRVRLAGSGLSRVLAHTFSVCTSRASTSTRLLVRGANG